MSAEKLKYKNAVAMIAAIMLLLAIPPIWPYGYYQLLRWAVTGSAVFIAYVAYTIDKKSWMWILIMVGILFNPLVPFYLSKDIWIVLDLIAAIIFFTSVFKISNESQ